MEAMYPEREVAAAIAKMVIFFRVIPQRERIPSLNTVSWYIS